MRWALEYLRRDVFDIDGLRRRNAVSVLRMADRANW